MNIPKKGYAFVCAVLVCCLMSCGGETKTADHADAAGKAEESHEPDPADIAAEGNLQQDEDPATSISRDGITLSPMPKSPEFKDAQLSIIKPTKQDALKPGKIGFEYAVADYELGAQTSDADAKLCANSGKGQHIHFIADNQPYKAHYTNQFEEELSEGDHIILSFLSRSYHESLKQPGAFVLQHIKVGKPKTSLNDDVLEQPHMFYSRPKGTYVGKDIDNVMLDFYLVNTELAMDGNKVKATINGTPFVLHEWRPYLMQGLPEGKNTVKLELIDASGKPVKGPFNTVERTFELFRDEPLNN